MTITNDHTVVCRALRALAAALVFCVATVSPVHAAGAQAPTGWARFGHFANASGAVDVLVDGSLFASDITFKSVTDYVALPSGVHTFELVPAGDLDGPAALETTVGVPDGGAVTVAAVTTRDGLSPQVYDDALTMPNAGRSLVRFIHAAPEAPAVDISVAGGPVLAADVPYPGATNYLDVAPGTYNVQITDSADGRVLLDVQGWTIAPGVQSTIVVVAGTDGRLDVAPVVDTASAAVVPAGGVQTGYGSMAQRQDSDPIVGGALGWLLLGALAAGALAAVSVTGRHRRFQSS